MICDNCAHADICGVREIGEKTELDLQQTRVLYVSCAKFESSKDIVSSVQDVFDTFTEEQKAVLCFLIKQALKDHGLR